jgi:hypothetical protein
MSEKVFEKRDKLKFGGHSFDSLNNFLDKKQL